MLLSSLQMYQISTGDAWGSIIARSIINYETQSDLHNFGVRLGGVFGEVLTTRIGWVFLYLVHAACGDGGIIGLTDVT